MSEEQQFDLSSLTPETGRVPVEGTSLAIYGEAQDAYILASRLLEFHPAARSVGKAIMLAAAQVALAMGANPLPGAGELDIWTDKDNKHHIRLGVQFHRRKGREGGGVSWRIRPRPMNKAERELYGVEDGHLAAICDGARMVDVRALMGDGFTLDQAYDSAGSVGIGTATAGEWAKKGRPKAWTAIKRAEQDCLRQLFPNSEGLMGFGGSAPVAAGLAAGAEVVNVIPHTVEVNGVLPSEEQEPAQLEEPEIVDQERPADGDWYNGDIVQPEEEDILPPADQEVRPATAEEVRAQLRKAAGWYDDTRIAGDVPDPRVITYVASTMSKMLASLDSSLRSEARHQILAWVFGPTSTKELTERECKAMTNRWTLPGSYELNDQATGEAGRILAEVAKENGQQELGI